jgi:uncharacterized protein YbjT (DUF2867 family)
MQYILTSLLDFTIFIPFDYLTIYLANLKMHLILTGATGLVGSSVLDAMLKNTTISKISILSRRPVPMADDAKDPRVRVIMHKDFESYKPELLDQLKDADGCVWALGTSQMNVTQE